MAPLFLDMVIQILLMPDFASQVHPFSHTNEYTCTFICMCLKAHGSTAATTYTMHVLFTRFYHKPYSADALKVDIRSLFILTDRTGLSLMHWASFLMEIHQAWTSKLISTHRYPDLQTENTGGLRKAHLQNLCTVYNESLIRTFNVSRIAQSVAR